MDDIPSNQTKPNRQTHTHTHTHTHICIYDETNLLIYTLKVSFAFFIFQDLVSFVMNTCIYAYVS